MRELSKRICLIVTLFWTSSALADATKIRIGYPASVNGEIVAVLEKAEIAKQQGLDAEYVFFQNGPPMMEALASGQLDVALTSFMPLITLNSRLPGTAVAVAGLGASSYALLTPGDSPIAKLADLKGKKIAVSFGSDSHADLLIALGKEGLRPGETVELLDIQPAELPVALAQKYADAIVIRQPQVARLTAAGAKSIASWPHYFVIVARAAYLKENPKGVDKLLAAVREAVAYSGRNPDQSAAWFAEKLRLDLSVVRALNAENPLFGPTKAGDVRLEIGQKTRDSATRFAEAAARWGLIKTKVDAARLIR